jgi:hypothetical protein
MKCHVFVSKSPNRYVIAPADRPTPDVEGVRGTEPWKTVTITKDSKLIGLDSQQALADIAKQGYHIAEPKLFVSE